MVLRSINMPVLAEAGLWTLRQMTCILLNELVHTDSACMTADVADALQS